VLYIRKAVFYFNHMIDIYGNVPSRAWIRRLSGPLNPPTLCSPEIGRHRTVLALLRNKDRFTIGTHIDKN